MAKAEHQEQIIIEATDHREFGTHTRMVSLDVGCGNNPKGDVNCDIYRESNPQVLGVKSVSVNPKSIKNFVLASGMFLPFKNDCFGLVYCHHTIEHIPNPQKALSELIRVCRGIVKVDAPHRFGRQRKGKYHQAYFNQTWFVNVLRLYGVAYEVKCTYRQFPLFFLPDEILVSVYKHSREQNKV